MTAPPTPRGFRTSGRRLWRSVVDSFELDEHELTLLRQACRVADTCDDLQEHVDRDGVVADGKAHPALVELRQQRILLARLVVALRVPLGEQEDDGEDVAPRTGYKGLRGVYGPRSVA